MSGFAVFDKSSLIQTVPAGAKLCCWARRVIASIFASALQRDNQHKLFHPPADSYIYDDEVRHHNVFHSTICTQLCYLAQLNSSFLNCKSVSSSIIIFSLNNYCAIMTLLIIRRNGNIIGYKFDGFSCTLLNRMGRCS